MSKVKSRQAAFLGHVMSENDRTTGATGKSKGKKPKSSKNKNTRRCSSLAVKEHFGDVENTKHRWFLAGPLIH